MRADDARAIARSRQEAKARRLPHPWLQALILRRIRKAAQRGRTSVDMPMFGDSEGTHNWLLGLGYQVHPGFMTAPASIDWTFPR